MRYSMSFHVANLRSINHFYDSKYKTPLGNIYNNCRCIKSHTLTIVKLNPSKYMIVFS